MNRFLGCYWCGSTALSVEHCPPQNLFDHLKSKNGLITLPSCYKHNEGFSDIDQYVSNYIKILSGDLNLIHSANSKMIKKNQKQFHEIKQIMFAGSRPKLPKHFSVKISSFLEKITRGMLYHHYKMSANGRFFFYSQYISQNSIIEDGFYNFSSQSLGKFNDGHNSHPSIFNHRYLLESGYSQSGIRGNAFLLKMEFYNKLTFFTIIGI